MAGNTNKNIHEMLLADGVDTYVLSYHTADGTDNILFGNSELILENVASLIKIISNQSHMSTDIIMDELETIVNEYGEYEQVYNEKRYLN